MESSYRTVLIALGCAAIALALLAPRALPLIAVGWAVALPLSWLACMRRIAEPYRPIVSRLGMMHRLGPPGFAFVIPLIEQISQRVSVMPHMQQFVVHQIASSDGNTMYMNLELTWRVRPDITTIDDALRQALLKTDEQLNLMIEQTVSVVARQLVLSFAPDHLKRADTRESVTEILRSAVNEMLTPHGLMIDTVFWRGSVPAADLIKERLAISISHERVEGLIRDITLMQERLPGMQADQIMLYQTWLDLLRRGIAPPTAPPGIFHIPTPPPQSD